CRLQEALVVPWQQSPAGVDAGAFHSDVLAVGHDGFLMLHELAFVHHRDLLSLLRARLGDEFRYVLAADTELAAAEAVRTYPFNSQIVTTRDGNMAIVAPAEARDSEPARRFLE